MTTTYFRIQAADRDVNELLDPGHQFSSALSHDPSHTREGVSVCESLDELAEYLASSLGNGIGARVREDWVIVELEGEEILEAAPLDPEYETLVRPTAIVAVRPAGEAFMAMIAAAETHLASFDTAPEFD